MCVLLSPSAPACASSSLTHTGGPSFGRHSNSINPATHGCPCGARLVAIDRDGRAKPVPGAASSAGAATPGTERKKSKWIEFMQVRRLLSWTQCGPDEQRA